MGIQKYATEQEFKDSIVCSDGKPVFVQFSAEWCGPCSAIEGNMTEFAAKYADKMHFRYLDADEYEDLFSEYEIANMPTFKIFKSGGACETMIGTKLDKIEEFMTKNC